MKVPSIIFYLLFWQTCFGQFDTVKVELKESSMSLKKCKGFLFNDYRGNTFSYPSSDKITSKDSLFIYNKDTVFFVILKNNKPLIKGLKLPGIEAFDTVTFYKKGKLIRQEVWVQHYFADSTGKTSQYQKNAVFASSDEATWILKREFRNGDLFRKKFKTIELDKEKGACFKTYRVTNKKEKIIKCTCY